MSAWAPLPRHGLWLALVWLGRLTCAAPPVDAPVPPPAPLFGWLSLDTTRPLVMTLNHAVEYDPAGPRIKVERSLWQVDHLRLQVFGGRIDLAGQGDIEPARPSDTATTLSLQAIDVQQALRFLNVPRAGEIEGRISGRLHVRIVAGDWRQFDVSLSTEPGSVRLSRELIKELLGQALDAPGIGQTVDDALERYYGSAQMIPIQSMRIVGQLGETRLGLSIPIRNRALSIDFDPQIDRQLLWELWALLRRAGLRDMPKVILK